MDSQPFETFRSSVSGRSETCPELSTVVGLTPSATNVKVKGSPPQSHRVHRERQSPTDGKAVPRMPSVAPSSVGSGNIRGAIYAEVADFLRNSGCAEPLVLQGQMALDPFKIPHKFLF